jgi:hypothetical protein
MLNLLKRLIFHFSERIGKVDIYYRGFFLWDEFIIEKMGNKNKLYLG